MVSGIRMAGGAAVACLAVVATVALVVDLAACGDATDLSPVDAGSGDVGALDAGRDGDANAASDGAPVPRGARVLGVGLDRGDPDYFRNLQFAHDAGATTTTLDFAWDDVEQPFDGGADASTVLFDPALHVANLVLSTESTSATMAVSALDVGGPRLPVDLAGRALDDPEVSARYAKLEDYVFSQSPDTTIAALLVGTEVDAPLGADPARWSAFATFVAAAAAHAKATRPGQAVGFGVGTDALVAHADLVAQAAAGADVVAVRYVAVDAVGLARPPSDVAGDLAKIAAAAPAGKALVLYAVGYPSAAACASSETAQGAFVDAIFRAWDANAARMGTLTFVSLVDAPDVVVSAEAARAGRSDAPFVAMLGSLGMRGQDGHDKTSLGAFVRNAAARGW